MTLETAETMIDHFFQTQPYISAFLTCSVKASAADVLAQVQGASQAEENASEDSSMAFENASALSTPLIQEDSTSNPKADLDWQRTAAFLFYGGLYQGLFQEFLYAGLFPTWFPNSDWQSVVLQVALDMAFFSVFLCLPIAYVVKTAFMSDGPVGPHTVQSALEKYASDVKERGLLFKYWGLWIPVQTLNFSVVPTHFRVAFVAVVSFFWMFILSTTSAQGEAKALAERDAAAAASE